jgi:hypothetical protein
MLTAIEQALLNALVDLEQAVASVRTANPRPDLQARFARIDELAKELPHGTDPNLLHFLQKRSYQKARRFLEGRGGENQAGTCRD